jgi:hypothetical protein
MTNPVASQQPAPIPEDLGQLYAAAQKADEIENPDSLLVVALIERIARLEAALTAMRDFMWSEGYADQTAVMRQADAALGTPGRKP